MTVIIAAISLAALLALHQYHSYRKPKVLITQAWPEGMNRDMKIYVQPEKITTIHEPKNVCSNVGYKKFFLLVIVNSAYHHFALRKNARDTWGNPSLAAFGKNNNKKMNVNKNAIDNVKVLNPTFDNTKNATHNVKYDNSRFALKDVYFRVIFVLGLPENGKVPVQKKIDDEANRYGDILQENFVDSYYNLSIKSTMMLKWITRNCHDRIRYVLKTDDDIVMSIRTVLNSLRARAERFDNDENRISDEHKMPEYVLLGQIKCNLFAIRFQSNKWYCPEYLYQEDIYPCFLGGKGYGFSMPAAYALYNAALNTPLFPLEDVYITGICRQNAVPHLKATYDMYIEHSIHEI